MKTFLKWFPSAFFFNVNTSVLGADPEGIAAPKTFKATWGSRSLCSNSNFCILVGASTF